VVILVADMHFLAVSVEPELLGVFGVIVAAALGMGAYAIVRSEKHTNVEVDVARIVRDYQKLSTEHVELLNRVSTVCAEVHELRQENSRLAERIIALEAEASDVEAVRAENRRLNKAVDRLRARVLTLEQRLRKLGEPVE
jgi:predicted nuclease with TOPRIM domain